MPLSGEERQQLKNFAQEQTQAASLQAQAMQQLEQQRVDQVMAIEQGRTVQKQAEAEGQLMLDAMEARMNHIIKQQEVLLKALGIQVDAAEAEVQADVAQANAIVGATKTLSEVSRGG